MIFCLFIVFVSCFGQLLFDDYPEYGEFSGGAIATDAGPCAGVGRDVLLEGGAAMDAAIAALLCMGAVHPHSSGIGGGFVMTVFSAENQAAEVLVARERAPGWAREDMYNGNGSLALKGPLSIAVPGEVAGYWEAKRRYGSPDISWERLLRPTITMLREGVTVDATLAGALNSKDLTDPGMRSVFLNPETGEVWGKGEAYTNPALADTMEMMAEAGDGAQNMFYNGSIADLLAHDIQALGGNITFEDLSGYSAEWMTPVRASLRSESLTLHSVPPPASGAVLAAILNILDTYDINAEISDTGLLYHRIVESFKWAYGARSNLGDPFDEDITDFIDEFVANITSKEWAADKHDRTDDDRTFNDTDHYEANYFTPEDHGTAHISVLAPSGDAVAVTTTINFYFGSEVLSPRTGIILNNEMDDFSFPDITNGFGLPPSPHNFASPGKRPLSSMCPTILTQRSGAGQQEARLVVGGAGGSKITTAVALTTLYNVMMARPLNESVDAARIHHQLLPIAVSHQAEVDENIIEELRSRGHGTLDTGEAGSVVGAVARLEDGSLVAKSDYRKSGGVAGVGDISGAVGLESNLVLAILSVAATRMIGHKYL